MSFLIHLISRIRRRASWLDRLLIRHFLRSIPGDPNVELLSPEGWSDRYLSHFDEYLASIRAGEVTKWTREVLKIVGPDESLLEVGAAAGVSSLYIGLLGHRVGIVDYAQELLDMGTRLGGELGVDIETVYADITEGIPLEDGAYDTVWHAGLLEHFSDEMIRQLTEEFARIAKRRVISFVPNAASLAYRIGKAYRSCAGKWQYGKETPKYTLRDVFQAAGLVRIQEYTIDLESALRFVPKTPLKDALTELYRNLPTRDDCHQGYLLVTVGEKDGG